jgi:small GTP-binding protein
MRTYQKKICLLGDFAVGKTSLVRRYIEGIFDEKYLTTVGVVVSRKSLTYQAHSINLLIWDLAGGRDFSHSGYLAGVAGAMLVCDITRATTLAAYRTYAHQIRQVNPNASLVLLANKSDLANDRSITDEELQTIAHELASPLFITSAKLGDSVDAAFTHLAEHLVAKEN